MPLEYIAHTIGEAGDISICAVFSADSGGGRGGDGT